MERNKEERAIRGVLSQIETPEYDMKGAVMDALRQKATPRRYRLPRAALVAGVMVAVLAVGAAAVGISGLWERFFPNPVPQNAISTIGVSQTSGDYTLTLEDAMADDNGIILLLTLSRVDGGSIDPEASISGRSTNVELWADGERFSAGGGLDNRVLSADGTSLRFCYEVRNNMDAQFGRIGLAGKSLTLKASGVVITLYSSEAFGYRPDETANLSPLAELALPDFSYAEQLDHGGYDDLIYAEINALNLALPLPLDEEFPLYTILGAADTRQGLAIALTDGRQSSGDRTCTGLVAPAIIDTRTDTRYDMHEGSGFEGNDGKAFMLYTFRDCPLTTADLPHLRLEVTYELDQILSTEPFSLTFTPDSGSAHIIPLNLTIPVEGTPLQANELRLSALGLNLRFSTGMDTVFDAIYHIKLSPVVTLKDGSTVQTIWQGGSGGDSGCSVAFQSRDENGARVFLDTDQIASVTLNGVTLWAAP